MFCFGACLRLSLIKPRLQGNLELPTPADNHSNRQRWTRRKLSSCWTKSGGASDTHVAWTFSVILLERMSSSSTAIRCYKRFSRTRWFLLEREVSGYQAFRLLCTRPGSPFLMTEQRSASKFYTSCIWRRSFSRD